MQYIYLHGFASGPESFKAQYLRDRVSELSLNLDIPNLNNGDFSHLTLTRQLHQVEALLPPLKSLVRVTIIGSSFGGLTAAWLAQRQECISRIVLLAPAFQFVSHWLPLLGSQQVTKWQNDGYLSVYHHIEKCDLPLHYQFVTDMINYPEEQLIRPIPTLILHGKDDEVIPLQASRDFARDRPWVTLQELDSDHGLGNVLPDIWLAIREFCSL
ncbi:MAG: hypothetical protein RLZZ338_1328 [Cyanobacteriota bacterium]